VPGSELAGNAKIPARRINLLQGLLIMNRIIWLVGAVVIILFVLGYFGLR
jgi:hypothetical protein